MSFYILHRHVLTTIIMTLSVVILVYVFVIYLNGLFLLLFFSLICLWINLLYWPIVNKYIVKKEEELEHEKET